MQIRVEDRRLTDGSATWNVMLEEDGYILATFHCINKESALHVASQLRRLLALCTVD